MICVICNNPAYPRLVKQNVQYYSCSNCETLFSGEIDQSGKVGGGAHEERNTLQNPDRIERVGLLTKGSKPKDIHVLDFGAGFGRLVTDLRNAGFNADGYDPYTEEFSRLPETGKYDLVTCIECCEHWSAPYVEVQVIRRALKNGGVIMLESSFIQVAEQEGIDLSDFFYIDPSVGHSTIFSNHGIDLLFSMNGFVPCQHYNRHVKLYRKYA